MWAFPIIHVIGLWGERTGLSFRAGAGGLGVLLGLPLLWAWRVGLRAYFFMWARAVIFLVSGAISMCLLRARLVRALSQSYVL